MSTPHVIPIAICAVVALSTPLAGQWVNHPTAKVPRTRNGKPNLTAPAPRTAQGTPDLSGLWRTRTTEIPRVDRSHMKGQ